LLTGIGSFYSLAFTLLVFATGIVGILICQFQLVYGQTETDSGANVSGYSNYTGRLFSLEFPSSSVILPLQSIPGSEIISIVNNKLAPALIFVNVVPDPEIPRNATQEDIESNLDQIFPNFVSAVVGFGLGNVTGLEEPSYHKYIVDGHRMGSTVFATILRNVPAKGMLVGTVVGNNDFFLLYVSPVNFFNQSIPAFERILKSVKFNDQLGFIQLNEKSISFKYPFGWRVEDMTPVGVQLPPSSFKIRMSGDPARTGRIDISSFPINLQEFGLTQNATQLQTESTLDQNFPKMIKRIQSVFTHEITNTQTPIYDKYVIDGHRAGSIIFTVNQETRTVKYLALGTIVRNNAVLISYVAPVEIFEEKIPVAEKIIKSIDLKS
jgi:hypothetical protein